jgi:uncharacterized protein involved in exopolysaccharide biosynthesis
MGAHYRRRLKIPFANSEQSAAPRLFQRHSPTRLTICYPCLFSFALRSGVTCAIGMAAHQMNSSGNSILAHGPRRPRRTPVSHDGGHDTGTTDGEINSLLARAFEEADTAPLPALLASSPAPATPPASAPGAPARRHVAAPEADEAWRPLIDMRTVIAAVLDTRRLIAALAVLGLAAGVLLATTIPKYFYSTVELLVDPRDLKISERELMPTGLPYDASLAIVENQTKIITSRRVLEATVDKLGLANDGEFNGKGLGEAGPVARLMELVTGSDPADEARLRETAVQGLQKAVSVSREPKSFVVFLTVRSEAADKAALIANAMADIYLGAQQDIQTGAAQRASGEIGGRLEALRADLEESERAVEAYKAENELFDANGKLISDDEILLISTQLSQARQRVAELRSRADSARQLTIDQVLSDALPEGAASNLISELRRGYAQKLQQRDALSQKLGPSHPQLQTAEAEAASAARAIETELRRLSQTTQIELQRAVQTEQELAANLARLKSRQTDISEKLVLLRELEREGATRRAIYENFLLRARETGEQADISTANTTIVSNAVPALRSYGTSRKLVAIGGFLGGLLLGIGIGMLRGIWRCIAAAPAAGVGLEPESAALASAAASTVPDAAPTHAASAAVAASRPVAANPTHMAARSVPHGPANPPQEPDMLYYPGMPHPQMMQPQPAQPHMMQPQMMPPAPYGGQPFMPQPVMMQQPVHAPAYGAPYPAVPAPMMPQMMPAQPWWPQMQPAAPMVPVMTAPMPAPISAPMAAPVQAYHLAPAYAPYQPAHASPMAAQPQPQAYASAPMPLHLHINAQPAPQMQSAPQPAMQPEPSPAVAAYDEIRERLRSLRDGITSLSEKRERLNLLG